MSTQIHLFFPNGLVLGPAFVLRTGPRPDFFTQMGLLNSSQFEMATGILLTKISLCNLCNFSFLLQTGEQVKSMAQGAADAVKNTLGVGENNPTSKQ